MTAVTYERLAELPVVIEEYALDGLSRHVSSGFRRFTTVFGLAGAGQRGVGKEARPRSENSRNPAYEAAATIGERPAPAQPSTQIPQRIRHEDRSV